MAQESKRSETHSLIHVEPIDKEYATIADFFTNKFDYVLKSDMYKPHQETLAIYDLYRQIMIDKSKRIKTPIITLSPDSAISGATIAGASEKFMITVGNEKSDKPSFSTSLKIIYIDSSPDLSTKSYTEYTDYVDSILADVMGLTATSYTLHRINLPPENICLLGIDETNLSDDQDGIIRKYNINMYTLQNLRKKGIKKMIEHIADDYMHEDVHICIDLSVIQKRFAPSVYRNDTEKDEGFDFDEMKIIVDGLKKLKHINGIDICGYNFGPKKDKDEYHASNILTIKTIQMIVSAFATLKQKSINIFNEDSKFLIYKPLIAEEEPDFGWLILRGMSLEQREEIIREIGDDDKILTVPIHETADEEFDEAFNALVTVTSIKEQQEKTFYHAKSITDCCLYPGEKVNMMFELLNTPQTQEIMEMEKEKISESRSSTSTDFGTPLIKIQVPEFVESNDTMVQCLSASDEETKVVKIE